jgi:hypothetical protein
MTSMPFLNLIPLTTFHRLFSIDRDTSGTSDLRFRKKA